MLKISKFEYSTKESKPTVGFNVVLLTLGETSTHSLVQTAESFIANKYPELKDRYEISALDTSRVDSYSRTQAVMLKNNEHFEEFEHTLIIGEPLFQNGKLECYVKE